MPLITAIPARSVTGSGSPLSVLVSTTASSLTTVPSTGTTSPVRTSDRVAGARPVDRHLFDRAVDPQLGDARRALDQERQLAARAAGGRGLERRAAGEHEADDRAGELLAERQRPDHRDERDRVDAEVMIDDHGAADLERELGGQQRHRGPPHLMAGLSCASECSSPASDRDGGIAANSSARFSSSHRAPPRARRAGSRAAGRAAGGEGGGAEVTLSSLAGAGGERHPYSGTGSPGG